MRQVLVGTRKGSSSSATVSSPDPRSSAGRSTTRCATRATGRSTLPPTTRCTARPSTARPTAARAGTASRRPKRQASSSKRCGMSSPVTPPSRRRCTSAARRACSSAPATRGRAGSRSPGSTSIRRAEQWQPGRGRPVLPLDPGRPRRSAPPLRGDLGRRGVPVRRRGRELAADQRRRRGRLHARSEPGGRAVRAQAAPPPGAPRPPLAAEPLRRLSLGRSRRDVGAARRQRPAELVRLRDRARPGRPGRGLRRARGERRESRHGRRPPRRLPDDRRRRVVASFTPTDSPSTPGASSCARA